MLKEMIATLWRSLQWGLHDLVSRPVYLFAAILVPLFGAIFFVDLLGNGLPTKVPTAIVDLDQTSLSRKLTMNLGDMEMIDIKETYNSYSEGREAMQEGKIMAFFVIPRNFAKDLLSGNKPQLSYYNNFVYFIPATLSYKAYRTEATLAAADAVAALAESLGLPQSVYQPMLQPISANVHPIHNPWLSYNYYISASFVPCLLVLMIMLCTAYSICYDIKYQRSREWLKNSNGSIVVALFGKMLPLTVIFTIVGWAILAIFYSYCDFPLHCPLWHMLLAMVMLVIASQGFAIFVCCIFPNMRLASTIVSLVGILSFSVAGFSFPVENMYPSIEIFAYILPIRHYFAIHLNQALNGFDLYYARIHYAVLAIFQLLPFLLLWRLKKAAKEQIYIP